MVLLCVRDRELRLRGGLSTVTRRWQPADARGSRGTRAGGHQGRGTGPGGKRMTRGRWPSRRWRGGDGRAAARSEALPVAEQN
jgi:hypothetical protein